jgi:hypothetical protein
MALGAWGRGIDARLREIEDFVLNRRRDLNGLLAGEIPRAKAELAKHCTDKLLREIPRPEYHRTITSLGLDGRLNFAPRS